MLKNADLNKLAFTELILSIDVSSSSGKIAFGILKAARRKIMKMGMQVWLGRISRRSLTQYLLLHYKKIVQGKQARKE